MTKTVVETARPLGIAVHDHIIIGRKGNASMKGLLLI
jgi:DNA repair protein RadC